MFKQKTMYGIERYNEQLSETPKLTAAINLISKESGEYLSNIHELMSSHFLNKLKRNPDMVKKILNIINGLNMQDMPSELKQLKNYLNQLVAEENGNNTNNNKSQK